MSRNQIIQNSINQAYYKLTNIAEIGAYMSGNYFDLIINKDNYDYADEIINQLFSKIINIIKFNISKDDIEFIEYKSFCFNDPSDELINDCLNIVNSFIKNKKSSNETTLFNSLNSLTNKYSNKEITKSLDTIFDILLDYYTIIRK